MRASPKINSDAYFLKEGYVYTANLGTITAGSTVTTNVNIDIDADFFITKGTYHAVESGTTAPNYQQYPMPNVAVQIQDTASGMQLFREPLPIPSIFGLGREPFIWPAPYGVMRGGTLQVTATNNASGTDYEQVFLNLIGIKAYVASNR